MRRNKAVNERILLVDDDTSIREVVVFLLETEGYRVSVAANGQQALDLLHKGVLPRVIILDLNMPVMDGWRFRAEQLADPTLREIPVIVTTGLSNPPTEAMGRITVLPKPIELDALVASIEEQLEAA